MLAAMATSKALAAEELQKHACKQAQVSNTINILPICLFIVTDGIIS